LKSIEAMANAYIIRSRGIAWHNTLAIFNNIVKYNKTNKGLSGDPISQLHSLLEMCL